MGLFITFEGGEGSGKSTQSRALFSRLRRTGIPAILTYEPGGTDLGKEIRARLKKKRLSNPDPLTELFLFVACRAQLVAEVIKPNLKEGRVVLCDRFADSTVAYQGYGQGISLKNISAINKLATGGITPDLVILLDIAPEKGLNRRPQESFDRFEQEDLDFHRRVRNGFLKMARVEPGRWLVVDAGLPVSQIKGIIWEKVSRLLSAGGYL